MDVMAAVGSLLPAVSELENAMQSAAFSIVRETGNYEASERLLEVARDLRAIGKRVEAIATMGGHGDTERPFHPSTGKARGSRPYPRFAISGDRVVKIGKGKSRSAKEYRHEAPKESFDKLVSWLESARASGKREWLAQDVVDALAGEVPSYQIYLMLAAMSVSGFIGMVRKGSYKESDPTLPTSGYWSSLRTKLGVNESE